MMDFIAANRQLIIMILNGITLVANVLSMFFLMAIGRSNKKMLQAAKNRDTFTICPNCHSKVKLSDLDFRLPTGELDNNLNGKPDDLE